MTSNAPPADSLDAHAATTAEQQQQQKERQSQQQHQQQQKLQSLPESPDQQQHQAPAQQEKSQHQHQQQSQQSQPHPQPSANPNTSNSLSSPLSQQNQLQNSQSHAQSQLPSNSAAAAQSLAVSPPTKRDLRSWWRRFQANTKHQEATPAESRPPQGIFGVPLRQSITYANVAISLLDDNGKSYIYGYVPIVVAKCGVFLKEKATGVEGIFRLSGSERRIKELKTIFDSPDRYGKGLVWDGYTVHDAANVLRRYLNDLPEPVVPLDRYEAFREPLRGATLQAVGDAEGPQFVKDFDLPGAIAKYQRLITELPPLNRQLLLYLLDLLAVFAAKSDENRMNSQNLAAIFQPGMLSHPAHAMAPEEYRLNQCVIIFLIENQDHFLIGMQGTAADEKTVQEVQNGTPPPAATSVVSTASRKSGVHRSASNASAGAESVARDGRIRRNRSVSSKHSRQSNGAPSPGSPARTSVASAGLGRSNTVPSKKSPAIGAGRFHKKADHAGGPVTPLTPATPTPIPPSPIVVEVGSPQDKSGYNTPVELPATTGPTHLSVEPAALNRKSQDGMLDPTTPDALTPSRERKLQSLFQRSPGTDAEPKPPNKLRKKRLVNSQNPSAQSSTASLQHSNVANSPGIELANPMEQQQQNVMLPEVHQHRNSSAPAPPPDARSDANPKAASQPLGSGQHPAPPAGMETTLKPRKSSTQSLHSSFNEGSDIDQFEDTTPPTAEQQEPEKDKKRRWRLSRRKEDMVAAAAASSTPLPATTSPRKVLGSNTNADASTSTIGSGSRMNRRSYNGESLDHSYFGSTEAPSSLDSASKEGRDESRGLTGWFKNKYREAKENRDERRNKSPPPANQDGRFGSTSILSMRGKSLDMTRSAGEEEKDNAKE